MLSVLGQFFLFLTPGIQADWQIYPSMEGRGRSLGKQPRQRRERQRLGTDRMSEKETVREASDRKRQGKRWAEERAGRTDTSSKNARKGRFGPEWEGEKARVAAGAPTVSTPPSAFCSRRPAF